MTAENLKDSDFMNSLLAPLLDPEVAPAPNMEAAVQVIVAALQKHPGLRQILFTNSEPEAPRQQVLMS